MRRTLLLTLALAAIAPPLRGQDVFTMTVSEYVALEEGEQYTINGYVIGLYQQATDPGAQSTKQCIENWISRPYNDGLWALSSWMRNAVIFAEYGFPVEKEGGNRALVILVRAILETCQ